MAALSTAMFCIPRTWFGSLAWWGWCSLLEWSYSMFSPVSTGLGDRLRAGIPPWYVTKSTTSTQPCIPLGSLNQVPALIGCGKGVNITSVRWHVKLCDSTWHVSSCSGEMCSQTSVSDYFTLLTYLLHDEALHRSLHVKQHSRHPNWTGQWTAYGHGFSAKWTRLKTYEGRCVRRHEKGSHVATNGCSADPTTAVYSLCTITINIKTARQLVHHLADVNDTVHLLYHTQNNLTMAALWAGH